MDLMSFIFGVLVVVVVILITISIMSFVSGRRLRKDFNVYVNDELRYKENVDARFNDYWKMNETQAKENRSYVDSRVDKLLGQLNK
jgi:CHASE3 domain sensor protein